MLHKDLKNYIKLPKSGP